MARKEFFDKELPDSGPVNFGGGSLKPKISEFTRKTLVFIKFVLGLCFLPFIYFLTVSFLKQFSLIDKTLQDYFWIGVVSFLIIYLFVGEPNKVYLKGQKLTELLFSFFKPLVKVAPYLIPAYTILFLIIYGALTWLLKDLSIYFLFLFGFSLSLHLVFSAKTMRARKDDFFKSNYIFGFSLVYILNILIFAFFLNFIFEKFSFVNLCNDSFRLAQEFFNTIFRQLFVIK